MGTTFGLKNLFYYLLTIFAKQQEMTNAQNNPIIQVNELAVIDEGNMLTGDFMALQIIQSQSSIVYPPFGQSYFS